MGLRELKKQKTRKAISDLATMLFIEHGFNQVTTAEIAERAEVSVPTLFKYFPTKESLVFDEDLEIENFLIESVLNRKKNQSILESLLSAGLARIDEIPPGHKKKFKLFMDFIDRTPELTLYAQQMWMRHEKSLSAAIHKEAKAKMSKLESEAAARYFLDSYHRAMGASNPKAALKELFKLFEKGWRE